MNTQATALQRSIDGVLGLFSPVAYIAVMSALTAAPRRFRPLLFVLTLLAGASLWMGLTLPLIEFTRLFFFTETPSLVQIVTSLWQDGDRLLAGIVGMFSIVLPALKIAGLTVMALGLVGEQLASLIRMVGKWSMLDVLLLALVIFAAKTSGIAEAVTRPGLIWFTASVVLSTLAAMLANRRPHQQALISGDKR